MASSEQPIMDEVVRQYMRELGKRGGESRSPSQQLARQESVKRAREAKALKRRNPGLYRQQYGSQGSQGGE